MNEQQRLAVADIFSRTRNIREYPTYHAAIDAIIDRADKLGIHPETSSDEVYRDLALNAVAVIATEFSSSGDVSMEALNRHYRLYCDGGEERGYVILPRRQELVTNDSSRALVTDLRNRQVPANYSITGTDSRKHTVSQQDLLSALRTELTLAGYEAIYRTLGKSVPQEPDTKKR